MYFNRESFVRSAKSVIWRLPRSVRGGDDGNRGDGNHGDGNRDGDDVWNKNYSRLKAMDGADIVESLVSYP